jgi:PKD repeat protein
MKLSRFLILISIVFLLICGSASADSFSAWSAYGDAWKATNDTYTMVMWNQTGYHVWLANASSVNYLIVAGGGSGGNANPGGGGGAGGVLNGALSGLSGTQIITVGAGSTSTAKGQNSSFANTTPGNGLNANGGGHGSDSTVGGNGGSGGGASAYSGTAAGGSATPSGQGFAGGDATAVGATYVTGGGGGAGTVGESKSGSGPLSGNGGAGKDFSAQFGTDFGISGVIGGGGGGGGYPTGYGTGGSGGGGNGGAASAGSPGIDGTGGGGGGGTTFAHGGSGVIIIQYHTITLPTASFTTNVSTGVNPLALSLNDTSTGSPTMYNTSWGDNQWTNQTSFPATNITHVYPTAGNYWINEYATNAYGTANGTPLLITVYGAANSLFSSFNTAGTAPFTTYFYDTSTNLTPGADTYYWMFGDGNISTSQNVYYTYNITGTYAVNHSFSNGLSTSWNNKTAYIVVGGTPVVAPVASFNGTPSIGAAPLTEFFVDVSANTPTSWDWDYGDGTARGTMQNPSHTYTTSGFFPITLIATNSAGSNTTVKSNFVVVY